MRHYLAAIIVFVMGAVAAAIMGTPVVVLNEDDQLLARAQKASDNFDVQEAVALYTKAIDSGHLTQPQLARAYLGRGSARDQYASVYGLQDGEMLLALRDFQKAIEVKPTVGAYQFEGNAFTALGAYSEATAAYQMSLPLDVPKPHWSLIGLARIERIQGHYDAAMKYLDQLIEIWGEDNGSMPIYYHRARVFFARGDFAATVDALTKGLRYQENYSEAYAYRGCAYARLGDFPKAIADLEKSIALWNTGLEPAWSKTPLFASIGKDQAVFLTTVKAMANGSAGESDKLSLCKWSWQGDDQARARSPLLGAASRDFKPLEAARRA